MQEQEVCKDRMQMIMKGKRTKRQRLPSPLRLTMSTTCSSDNSIGFDLTTTTTSNEFMNGTQEEEDMANCLILLAQGHHHHHHIHTPTKPSHRSSSQSPNSLYECKTCNRCFPSFQALGGHRASHKKPKANIEEKQGVTTTSTFVNELGVVHDDCYEPTSTTLTLQLSSTNKGLYNNTKSKVHECSICGAEFSSGQALGGHMRRHRNFVSNPIPTTTISMSGSEAKKHKDVLDLDLNLPAPDEDDHSRDSKLFPFQSKDKVIVFSATSLVDCHY